MSERQRVGLELQGAAIPALRTAFSDAISQLNDVLTQLRREGNIPVPWLGDEISTTTAAFYTSQAMDGPRSSYQSLVSYRDELSKIFHALQQMEEAYRRGEGDEAARWGPRT